MEMIDCDLIAPFGRAGRAATTLLLLTTLVLGGCASFYVDPGLKDVAPGEIKAPAQPQPVQMLFEFQTKGVLNARATDRLKGQVVEQVKASGLFSAIDDKPVTGGALLGLTVNNIPLTDDAAAKGFVTGLTFGLAGNEVADGYICTLKYIGPGQSGPIEKTERHAIHATVGLKGAPEGAAKSENAEAAVRTMLRQIIGHALVDLSSDTSFK